MPALKQYQIFVSHSWKYDDEYKHFINLLDNAPYFYYHNFSAPVDNPLDIASHSKAALHEALVNQIKYANVVIILSGMYVNYSDTILDEIAIAKAYNKPIVAVKPWGNKLMPATVQQYATVTTGWLTSSIIDAIRYCVDYR